MRTTIGDETFGYFMVIKNGKYLKKYYRGGKVIRFTRSKAKGVLFTTLSVAENFARLVEGKVVDVF